MCRLSLVNRPAYCDKHARAEQNQVTLVGLAAARKTSRKPEYRLFAWQVVLQPQRTGYCDRHRYVKPTPSHMMHVYVICSHTLIPSLDCFYLYSVRLLSLYIQRPQSDHKRFVLSYPGRNNIDDRPDSIQFLKCQI